MLFLKYSDIVLGTNLYFILFAKFNWIGHAQNIRIDQNENKKESHSSDKLFKILVVWVAWKMIQGTASSTKP